MSKNMERYLKREAKRQRKMEITLAELAGNKPPPEPQEPQRQSNRQDRRGYGNFRSGLRGKHRRHTLKDANDAIRAFWHPEPADEAVTSA